MPYEDIESELGSLNELSGQDTGGQEMSADPGAMGGPPDMGSSSAPSQPPGGPGVDTPQEQQAVKLLMQGAQAFRQAATVEPSVRYIVDKMLQETFLSVTKHYGMEQEGKLALQQAKLGGDRAKAVALSGPPGPPSFG